MPYVPVGIKETKKKKKLNVQYWKRAISEFQKMDLKLLPKSKYGQNGFATRNWRSN